MVSVYTRRHKNAFFFTTRKWIRNSINNMKLHFKVNELQILHLAFLAKTSPRKCGFLEKKSGKRVTDQSAVRWQKRWCAFYYNFLFYYESESSTKPQGVIFLDGVYIEKSHVTDLVCKKSFESYLFNVIDVWDFWIYFHKLAKLSLLTKYSKNSNYVHVHY